MRLRLVLVMPFAPAAEGRHGGVQAVHGLARELARRHDVILLHLDRGQLDPALEAACVEAHAIGVSDPGQWGVRARGATNMLRGRSLKAAASSVPPLQRKLRSVLGTFAADVVQVEFGVLGDVLAAAPRALRVLTIHEPAASLRESLSFRGEGLPLVHRLDARVARREERRAAGRADAVVVFTERDRRLVERSAGLRAELATIPLGWDVPEAPLNPVGTGPPTVLFIGSFAHPPNVDAALRLGREVFPIVRASHPDARLDLVGGSPPPEVLALVDDRISVTGEVPSVTPHLDRAAVVAAPLALGGGMRIKVLEALAAGKAVVASTRAVEGIGAVPGRDLVVADGTAATAGAISRLLGDELARSRMAERGRAWACGELSFAAMADRYEELYARLGPRSTSS